MTMAKERHAVAFVLGAAIGGAIGAVVGLLNAPRPGIETRTDLTERWHDVEERTAEEIVNFESGVRDRLASEWVPVGNFERTARA
jgi:gas vesicle protein